MKKIILLVFILITTALNIHSQIYVHGNTYQNGIPGSNAFFDASTGFSNASGVDNNTGKGMVIPSVDLTTFEFTDIANGLADGITFPTYFDGMIVYNRATGTTRTDGNRSSTATDVEPGFYFFYNPNGETNQNVTAGVWRPLGGNAPVRGNPAVKQLEIMLNEDIRTQSKMYVGTTAVTSSPIKIVAIEPQLTGDATMIATLLKVNALANLDSSATTINWSVTVENDNILSAKSCTLVKVIISYICDDNLTNNSYVGYVLAGR